MYGFADEALVLFPKYEFYQNADYRIKANLRIAAEKMNKYLVSRGIQPKAFITDDIARLFTELGYQWVSTLSTGDLFFMSKNCDMAENVMKFQMKTYPEIYQKSEEKYPYPPNPTIEERFDLMCQRDVKSANAIIPEFKIVVNFYQRGAQNYSAASKPGDGRIRLVVDMKTFKCTPHMSGEEEDAIDLLGANFASRSVLHWEV